jgi:RimJ/RimL family protein N-acetyltransferase
MRVTIGRYQVDDDPARIDVGAAVAFLTSEAYWGRWRGEEDIRQQIAASWRVVGGYDETGAMVGFARAVADGGSAYLSDVYVLREHRGTGLGKAIVRMMVDEDPGPNLRWMLHTSDAHGLYRSFGFARPNGHYLERPGRIREGGEPSRDRGVSGHRGLGFPQRAEWPPELQGKVVRLEPLQPHHVPGLVAAASGGEELYRWSPVPQDEATARRYVEAAMAARDEGTAVPFAVVRAEDDVVIGSTRFFDLSYWPWPEPRPEVRTAPDTCEIGYSWLSPAAIRTGANTEMKRLMLTHAFEAWQVQSVCLHTDARNQRSREAMERIGLRFEGILRSHRLGADSTPRDSARFSVTATEWPQVRRRLDELARRYQQA